MLTKREFVGEQGVCDGDSGGPALDARGRVVGVASRATEDCGLAVYSAVAPWRDWIVGVADRALELGTYDAPAWLATEDELGDSPEDTSEPIASNDVASGSDAIGPASPVQPRSHLDNSSCALTDGVLGGSSSGQGPWATGLAVAGLALGLGRRRSRPR